MHHFQNGSYNYRALGCWKKLTPCSGNVKHYHYPRVSIFPKESKSENQATAMTIVLVLTRLWTWDI